LILFFVNDTDVLLLLGHDSNAHAGQVSSKIGVIESLLAKCDKLVIGGGMVFTFLKVILPTIVSVFNA
jgi:hypothetical protein